MKQTYKKVNDSRLRRVEAELLDLALQYGSFEPGCYEIKAFDTPISVHQQEETECYIHAVRVECTASNRDGERGNGSTDCNNKPPLVLVHGFMAGLGHSFKNLAGLSELGRTVYAIDLLGFGLSSRPKPSFLTKTRSAHERRQQKQKRIDATEAFFVESLESWRQEQPDLGKMVLVGHSLGGYIATSYAELHPEHIAQLVLVSPLGLTDVEEGEFFQEDTTQIDAKSMRSISSSGSTAISSTASDDKMTTCCSSSSSQPWHFRQNPRVPKLLEKSAIARNFYKLTFKSNMTGHFLPSWPKRGLRRYVYNEFREMYPFLSDEETRLMTEYRTANYRLPGSGVFCLKYLVKPSLYAYRPLQHRIPHLRVKDVTIIHGEAEWLDTRGAKHVVAQTSANASDDGRPSKVHLVSFPETGHSCMMERPALYHEELSKILDRDTAVA